MEIMTVIRLITAVFRLDWGIIKCANEILERPWYWSWHTYNRAHRKWQI